MHVLLQVRGIQKTKSSGKDLLFGWCTVDSFCMTDVYFGDIQHFKLP